MKHYVFLQIITGAGGVQSYVAAKARYLEEIGWHVVVIGNNRPRTKNRCLLKYLDKFLRNGNPYTSIHPNMLPRIIVDHVIRNLINSIDQLSEGDEVIVESWNSETAIWGELLAKRIHGRHLFWTANEYYRTSNSQYVKNIDFFKFKMDRGEILTSVDVANRLFEGYKKYKKGDFIEISTNENPIQDVQCEMVENVEKKDFNICYIGRVNKPYVPNVIEGVEVFAKSHKNKQIVFLIVGDASSQHELLKSIRQSNLTIVELGYLYPIPRKLFEKVDVVIAGSGSARHSVDEGALVISIDSETGRSHGLLGYDTNDSLFVSNVETSNYLDISFEEALESALITKEWRFKPYIWRKGPSISECMLIQENIVAHAASKLVYYDSNQLLAGKVDWIITLRYLLHDILGWYI